jgi:nitrite reductase/ring-hydroxylating ferredoxin subunit
MTGYSKLVIFLLAVSLLFYSCNREKNDVIPDVYVDFTIDLNDPEFFELNAIGSADTIDSRTNNLGFRAAGFNSNGIILYRYLDDQFVAFDRTCPHDYVVTKKNVKVNIDGIFAVCPECGTTYAMPSGGTPYSGIGQYPLKNYRTSFDGRWVRVWNSY